MPTNKRPGFKFADYQVKGVPVRLVMGGTRPGEQ